MPVPPPPLPVTQTGSKFPILEVIETDKQPEYFVAREPDGFLWASPRQTCPELSAGDKQERETAEQVRSDLLNRLEWCHDIHARSSDAYGTSERHS